MIRRRTWMPAAAVAVLPLAFATPAQALTPTAGELPAGYATGEPDAGLPGGGSPALATDRQLPEGATEDAAATAEDGALAATAAELAEVADGEGAFGVYYDPTNDEFVVVAPSDQTTVESTYAEVTDDVRVETSTLAAATVAELTGDLTAREFHPTATEYAFGTYVDLVADVVVLGTDAPAAVVAPLVDGYGDAVEVRYGDDAGRARQNDFAPFWGGASITNGSSVCSSGFTVQSGGVRFMMTAGHCFATNDVVTSTGSGDVWGTFHPHVDLPEPDLAIIAGGSYQGATYVGGVNSTTGAAVSSFGDPVVGFDNYCFSGQTSGEVCGHTAVSLSGTLCDPLGCTTNLVVSDGTPVQPGDSGSGWYALSGGGQFPVHIRGLTVGVVSGQSYWHSYGTIAGTGVTGVPFP